MTAEREALDLAKSAIERLEQAVSLLDDTFFYTEGYHKSIVEFTDRFAKIDQALANPATIRDTDEDAEPFTYAYRYPSFPPKGATVIRFGTHGREINGSKPIEAIPLYRRLASSTPARDTDEDAVEADMRAYAEAAMQHGWKTAVDAAANGRLVDLYARDWFEKNPPKCARLASSTPAEPDAKEGAMLYLTYPHRQEVR